MGSIGQPLSNGGIQAKVGKMSATVKTLQGLGMLDVSMVLWDKGSVVSMVQ